jgi:Lrp/AsnC family leucine-responsive transcriptional regulator
MNCKDFLADQINIKILRLLQEDPRMSISQLARQIKMSNPAAKERVVRLEESGIISGYRLELDPKELGYSVTAFVRVRPAPGQLPKIAELARQIPEVAECHRITGEDCFILKLYLPEISSLDRILDRFLAFGQTTTSIVQSSPVLPRSAPLPEKA